MIRALVGALVFLVAGGLSASAEDVTIGVTGPTSGPDSVFGRQIAVGVQQAVADLNAAGGVLGRKIKVIVRDDASDPKKAVEAAKEAVSAQVPFVVGPFSSATTAVAAPVYGDGGVLEITPSATAPQITEHGIATLFRTCAREDAQVATAVRYLMAAPAAKIAIVHDRTTFGKATADAVRKGLAVQHAREAFYGSFDRGSGDLVSFSARVKASGAQILFFGGAPGAAGALVRQLREINARTVVLGGLAMASDEFAASAGAAADGALVVFPRDPRANAAAAALLRRLTAAGVEPQAYVFNAYAAVEVWHEAAAIAGDLAAVRVAEVLHQDRSFATVLGPLRFDAKGDLMTPDLAIFVWHRGATGKMTIDEQAKGS